VTVLEHLKPSTLRDLAAALEARLPPDRLCSSDLTSEGVERLAEILECGGTPALGLWKKYRRRQSPSNSASTS